MAILGDLTARCATTRVLLDNALTNLVTIIQIFLSKHSPMSDTEHADYHRAFKTAIDAGRSLFPPQEAYRSAIATFGMLISDLIDALPKKSVVRKRMRKEFDEGMVQANMREEGVRKSMRGLVDGTCKGGENYALRAYMSIVRQRLGNYGSEEERFKAWADECRVALLREDFRH